jgi:hypothetical protein
LKEASVGGLFQFPPRRAALIGPRLAALITVNVQCDLTITVCKASYRAVPTGDAVPVGVRGPASSPPPRLSCRQSPPCRTAFRASLPFCYAPLNRNETAVRRVICAHWEDRHGQRRTMPGSIGRMQ